MTKKLYELPDNSPIRVTMIDGSREDATFGHLDGMYSYCYLDRDHSEVFHLKGDTPMVEVDGRWEFEEGAAA
jgi:hypothetical protein